MTRVTKKSDWLFSWWMLCSGIQLITPESVEIFSLARAVLPLLSAPNQSCCNEGSLTFLANVIVPDLFKWTLLSLKCISIEIVSVWSMKVISRSPHMLISRLFTSCALLFRVFFRGTISDVVTVFVSDFSDSARSMADVDIWLTFFLFLSSLVPTCNVMWSWLNSQVVGLKWSYIQLTLAPLNDLTLTSFSFHNCFVKR